MRAGEGLGEGEDVTEIVRVDGTGKQHVSGTVQDVAEREKFQIINRGDAADSPISLTEQDAVFAVKESKFAAEADDEKLFRIDHQRFE